jgi:hypothetical protein
MFADYRPDDDRFPVPAGLDIRAASASDCASIAAIAHERDPDIDPIRAEAHCTAQVADPDVCLLIASVGDEICGFGRAARFEAAADAPPNSAPDGRRLTEARLAWLAERTTAAFYFVNARNRVSLDLHEVLGFREVTRDFSIPGATFDGGVGSLGRIDLTGRPPADDVRSRR